MRGQLLKSLVSLMITLLCLGSLLTTIIWCMLDSKHHSNVETLRPPPRKKRPLQPSDLCKGCGEVMDKVVVQYALTWKKNEDSYQKFRSQLNSSCHGGEKAIITQANTPVGSKIVYDAENRVIEVNQEIFKTFIKENPLANKTWDTCSVVGNGGILVNSSCGNEIDSAQLVIRCNLPPLTNGYEKHVGVKTDIVTANPSILVGKYGALMGRRHPFVESLHSYGNSLMLLPAFSIRRNTPLSLQAIYTIEDFGSPIRPVFFNPEYLQNLTVFWRSQGVKEARLSTGLMMVSLALELCTNVHLYGFWPFSNHPHDFRVLTNHYYDNIKAKRVHAMPAEFKFLLGLHSQGVLRLHLEDCPQGEKWF